VFKSRCTGGCEILGFHSLMAPHKVNESIRGSTSYLIYTSLELVELEVAMVKSGLGKKPTYMNTTRLFWFKPRIFIHS
jgi:hypothetical protein